MASQGEKFCCSICLEPPTDSVAIPCGDSYCMSCIQRFWDAEDKKGIFTCPECKEVFTPRPVLEKNITLADIMEELKKTRLRAAPDGHRFAGPEDMACDVSTDKKIKACEEHLQPSKKLLENLCSRHHDVMKLFCRTDQQAICYRCSVNDHRGHDTVLAVLERTKRQRELEERRLNIQQRIQERETDMQLLQQEMGEINDSADEAVEHSEEIFTELIRLMQKQRSDMRKQVRSQQQTELSRVRELQEKLQQEISELKKKDAELQKLSRTQDDNQFLQDLPSLLARREPTHSSRIDIRPLRYFKDLTEAVSEVREEVLKVLREGWTKISQTVANVDVLLPHPEPTTRAEFLKCFCDITLDPNTAHTRLTLSKENSKAAFLKEDQSYPRHPDRFTFWIQILSRESLTGRCYWEVERSGGVCVAVSYKTISRDGSSKECGFGRNDKSWSLHYHNNSYIFWTNNVVTSVPGPWSNRIGVYLDHRAGILSFYSVSETMTLLHRVQTTFTQPLHAGLKFYSFIFGKSTAEFSKLNPLKPAVANLQQT